GLDDDVESFRARTPLVAELLHHHAGLRIGRTHAVAEALAPTVVEQRVTSGGAHRSWASLVRRFGEPAPGPADLFVPPSPNVLARVPTWTFHRADIDGGRARTITFAMSRAGRLEETDAMTLPDA